MNDSGLSEKEWLNEFLKIRVESAGLSKRTTEALIRADIKNIGGIIRRSASSLREINGLGERGLNEIQNRFNLPLISKNNQTEGFNTEWQGLRPESTKEIKPDQRNELLQSEDFRRTPVELSDLSSRTKKALIGAHIRTIGGIIRKSLSKTGTGLAGIKGLGVKGISEIKSKIEIPLNAKHITQYRTEDGVEEMPNITEVNNKIEYQNRFNDQDDIISILSKYLGYKKEDIEAHSRKKEVVRARDLIIYMLREYGDMSYPGIGRLLGGRDHTTIIHAHKKIKNEVLVNTFIEKELAGLIDKVRSIKEKKDEIENSFIPEVIKNLGLQNSGGVPAKLEYKEIPERNRKIIELYREGLTLRSISSVFNVTHERIRQIVEKTITQLAVNESVSRGITMDTNVFRDEERKKRDFAINKKNGSQIIPVIEEKTRRWSRYYLACKKCNTTAIPHVRNGLCEQCVGQFRAERRENIIKEHNDICDFCGVARHESIRLHGRDFYITKDRRVFCRKCFLNESGRKLGSYKNYQWSRFFSQCKSCGTTSVPHSRKGLCENCDNTLTSVKREATILNHGGSCEYCGISRSDAIGKYNRDLYIMRNNKIACRECFMKNGFRKKKLYLKSNYDKNII